MTPEKAKSLMAHPEYGKPIFENRGGKMIRTPFVRDFCCECAEPIRVYVVGRNFCTECYGSGNVAKRTFPTVEHEKEYHGNGYGRSEW